MICKIYASRWQNRKITRGKNEKSDGSAIYLSLHYRYIAYVNPKCFNYNNWNFPHITFCFNRARLFLFPFNGMLFNVKRTVDPVFWCLFIRLPSNLPDMTGRVAVFQEVDWYVKQIKSYLIPERKRALTLIIYQNQRKAICF